jgi:NAD(P)-dependent dehydrogenase (short-subunit alcohol dehydrogenase family)
MRLEGKVALITGAGSGIGRAMALLFAREGALLTLADRDLDAAGETEALVHQSGGIGTAIRCDVTVGDDVRAAVDGCVRAHGRIDILCNNAGVGSTQNVIDTPEDVWDRCFDVNVKGVFWGCKYALPHMISRHSGAIVNTSSVAGLVGIQDRAAYCASKGAIISLTKAMAVDHVADGIRINCVCPGTVDSPWVARLLSSAPDPAAARHALEQRQPMGRLGLPEEVALAALYLASDEASYTTGTALVLDGGWLAK